MSGNGIGDGEEEGFLARWSRRKREAATRGPTALPPEPAAPAAAPAPPVPDAAPPPTAEAPPPFDAASLPPVESLTQESDITAFLRAEVPAALRQAALRRIWSLDPAIRDFVGPADYAYDYNAPDGVPGFALNLGGDVKRLLAQAIGIEEQEERPPAGPPRTEPLLPAAQAEAATPPEEPARPEPTPPEVASRETAPPEPPDSVPPGPEPPAPMLARVAAPEPPPEASARPPPRRHGRALPS